MLVVKNRLIVNLDREKMLKIKTNLTGTRGIPAKIKIFVSVK